MIDQHLDYILPEGMLRWRISGEMSVTCQSLKFTLDFARGKIRPDVQCARGRG
jgi:hypothetical protein